jgi:hypothetical protein
MVCPGLYSDCFIFTCSSYAIVRGNWIRQLQSYFKLWIMPTQGNYVFLTNVITTNIAPNSINSLVFVLEADFIFCYMWTGFFYKSYNSVSCNSYFPCLRYVPPDLNLWELSFFPLRAIRYPSKSILLSVKRQIKVPQLLSHTKTSHHFSKHFLHGKDERSKTRNRLTNCLFFILQKLSFSHISHDILFRLIFFLNLAIVYY